ncbi:hypothetical protein CUJ83_13100 [Methanocella sp. CWC-04]|uniref:Uncharacterized protein n=1 Tax=Methanooceanicella nereidis TaxID=2052831 RepID=A0AAP2W715_9EURY|nr:hypothetical protein [Methanocella sp. CWC-04]MCD1295933.1 hypothetical protein [Methanocella sp. CWC-04]
MSIKYQAGSKIQAVIDALKKEYPEAAIQTLSHDFDSYDMILEHDSMVLIIGIKLTRATSKTVFKLLLYAKAVAQRYSGKKVVIKLYAPSILPEAETALRKSGGIFQKLGTVKPRGKASDTVKICSPGSWKVVCYFIKNEESTMNQASVNTGVSYPWARAVIKKLIELGAFEEKGKKVRLANIDELFKAVAWERPISSLKGVEFKSAFHDEQEALREIFCNIEGIIPRSACALYTAADLYLEGRASGGCVQMYADENSALVIKSMLGEGDGVIFQIYYPDRDFGDELYSIDDIHVVSMEQTILDLAGLGIAGSDAAKVMARQYRNASE